MSRRCWHHCPMKVIASLFVAFISCNQMTYLKKRKSVWSLCTFSHSTPIKRCWVSFDFQKCCLCRTTFCRLIALRRKKFTFLRNTVASVTASATRVLKFKVEYRNQFCRNCKRANACRLRIGEKREFKFMLANPAFKEVASCLNSHRHFEIQSCLIWAYIPFFVYI